MKIPNATIEVYQSTITSLCGLQQYKMEVECTSFDGNMYFVAKFQGFPFVHPYYDECVKFLTKQMKMYCRPESIEQNVKHLESHGNLDFPSMLTRKAEAEMMSLSGMLMLAGKIDKIALTLGVLGVSVRDNIEDYDEGTEQRKKFQLYHDAWVELIERVMRAFNDPKFMNADSQAAAIAAIRTCYQRQATAPMDNPRVRQMWDLIVTDILTDKK